MSLNNAVATNYFKGIPKLIDINEAAVLMRCSKKTVLDLIEKGDLGYYKFKRIVRLSEEEIFSYIEQYHNKKMQAGV